MHIFIFAALTAPMLSRPAPRPTPSERARSVRRTELDPDRLYSLRERRRIATYLRLRLDQMREERLERLVDVIERRLPVDTLFADPTPPPR
jgi:hypothetical protein